MNSGSLYDAPTEQALKLWVKLIRCYSTIMKVSSESIRSFGLTEPQFAVIETLGHLGPLPLSVLSKKQLVTCANITLVVDNLEKTGYVRRVRSETDRRVIQAELTTKGKRLFTSTFHKHASVIKDAVGHLTEKEVEQLGNLLKKLGAHTEQGEE